MNLKPKVMAKSAVKILKIEPLTHDDIILEDWLNILLGNACVHVLSKEDVPGYVHGRIDEEMIGIHYNGGNIYVCGPPPMMEEIGGELDFIGFPPDLVVKEEF